jgi:hypothetical protein
MKRLPFNLIFSALLVLIVAQSNGQTNAGFSTTVSPWDYPITNHAGQPKVTVPLRARTGTQLSLLNNANSLDDVTLLLTNSGSRDFEIWLYPVGSDDYYYMDVPPNRSDLPLTVPEGTYDISIAPDDDCTVHHYITYGCSSNWGGYGPVNFYGVSITTQQYCNGISYE